MPFGSRTARLLLRTRGVGHDLRWLSRRAIDPRWYPQGIDVGDWHGRRTIAVTWFRKDASGEQHEASRITMIDVRRGTSVDLALAVAADDGGPMPARIHAGGLAWMGDRLLVAATDGGLWEYDLGTVQTLRGADARRVTGSTRRARGALAETLVRVRRHDVPLRCSFVGRAHPHDPASPRILVGEYRREDDGRLGWNDVPDRDAPWGPWASTTPGIPRMQGVVERDGELWVSQSRGMRPGSLWRGTRDGMARTRQALPVGCEDLAIDERTRTLWTVAEHPWRRRVHGLPLPPPAQ